jgi:hypothetical protein
VPAAWLHVLFWAGLRGAVAVAMALSLPADLPQRELLQEITFGVVLFTLLVQGRPSGGSSTGRSARPRAKAPSTGEIAGPTLASAEQPATVGLTRIGRLSPTRSAQDLVDLLAVVAADRRAIEPLHVLDVGAGDLPSDQPA